MNATVEVALSIDVSDQLVVKDTKQHVVGPRQAAVPCQDGFAVHAFPFDRPPTDQGEGDL
ncbi:MAG TPA: hypothetical protein D7I09_00705 [Candidatus Poseidoniales archaeon]|nr:MAG TPA: hypothetical protein D7I09_00705 [Candidatus Poseidoniales archaeon]